MSKPNKSPNHLKKVTELANLILEILSRNPPQVSLDALVTVGSTLLGNELDDKSLKNVNQAGRNVDISEIDLKFTFSELVSVVRRFKHGEKVLTTDESITEASNLISCLGFYGNNLDKELVLADVAFEFQKLTDDKK
jgi:hypothetical protein